MKKFEEIYKQLGETPLEALERFRAENLELKSVPMTYAGRLDPMAEGELLILIGDECKNKEKYLGLDKEYEVEIVFGISTDSHDALGLAEKGEFKPVDLEINKYVGRFSQTYPAYSSKTVKGKQLHELARADELPEEMPQKEVEIYSVDLLGQNKINADELKSKIFKMIDQVKGDFRQEQIKNTWTTVLKLGQQYELMKIRVKCASGTYMRSLADRIGKDTGTGAFALTIKRDKILGLDKVSKSL